MLYFRVLNLKLNSLSEFRQHITIMKSILKAALIASISMTGMLFTSCEKDKCKEITCANNGVCNSDGSCTCPLGYEGNKCEIITRDKFKGSWNVIEDGSISSPEIYTLSIENGTEIDQVIIRNMNNFSNVSVNAKVQGDTLFIPLQNMVQDGITKSVEGKGYFVFEEFYGLHGKLTVKYRVIDSEGNINDYGYRGAGVASEWHK